MKINRSLKEFISQSMSKDGYWIEKAKLEFAIGLEKKRKSEGLTYTTIAEKIGTSAAYITKVFRGDANLTIESMVKLSRATGGKLDIKIIDQNAKVDSSVWVGKIHNLKAANQASTPIKTKTIVEDYREAA